jgi:hypothetical protein
MDRVLALFGLLLAPVSAFAAEEAEEEEAEEGEETEEGKEEAPPKDCPKPEKVSFGAHINNLHDIDLRTHSYEVDAYLWFRWCDPGIDPSSTFEFVNASELWGHMVMPLLDEPEEMPDGSLYQVVRVQGRFSTKMPLQNYPFDRQTIGPIIEDGRHDATGLVYVNDGVQPSTLNPRLILPGYLIGDLDVRIAEEAYPTTFGDLRVATATPYSRAHVEIPLLRPLFTQLVQQFVPLLSVIAVAALMFVLSPRYVDSRVSVGITAMLTIVALQMTYNQDLPDVGYLMLMDKVYLASYLFVMLGLVIVVRTAALVDAGRTTDAERMHRVGLMAAGSAYVIAVAALVWAAAAAG